MARQNFENLTYQSNSHTKPMTKTGTPSSPASTRLPFANLDDNISMDSDDYTTDFESSPHVIKQSNGYSGPPRGSTHFESSPSDDLLIDLNNSPRSSYSSAAPSPTSSSPESSPCSQLAITKDGQQNARQFKSNAVAQFRDANKAMILNKQPKFQVNLPKPPLQTPSNDSSRHKGVKLPKPAFQTPASTKRGRVNFTPGHSVVSYSKMSSPSKVQSNLLQLRRTTPSAHTPEPDTDPELETDIEEEGDEDEWEDDRQFYYPLRDRVRSVFWDPMTPFIVSGHIQNGFNMMVLAAILYFFYVFIQTVRHDVDMKVEEYSAEIMAEMAVCSKEYLQNNCMPGRRVPALEKMCNSWEKCMNRDPLVVGRAKVGAETFGEIFNGFLKPISWKSMTFMVVFVGGTILLSNLTLMYTRKNLQPRTKTQTPPQQQHPRTPSSSSTPRTPGTRFYTPRRGFPSSRKPRSHSPYTTPSKRPA